MLRYYVEEVVENVIIEEKNQGCYKKCNKSFSELKVDNYIKNKRICRSCYNKSRRKNRVVLCFLLASLSNIYLFSNCSLLRCFY